MLLGPFDQSVGSASAILSLTIVAILQKTIGEQAYRGRIRLESLSDFELYFSASNTPQCFLVELSQWPVRPETSFLDRWEFPR